MYELYRGVRGHVPLEKKMKIGLSKTRYPAFPGSNAVNSYVYFVERSVLSLVIHNSRALFSKPFQSQANCKLFHVKSLLISSQSECFFNGAIHLWVCNSVNITCKAIVFQAVLNISVTQNPLSTRTSPKGAQKIVTLPSCGLRKFLSSPNWRPKIRIPPPKFTSPSPNS